MTSPAEIRLAKSRAFLEIHWSDGITHRITAAALRAHCRSATAIRGVVDRAKSSDSAAIRITGIEPIGGYAVHLAFSDGEERGIYPWSLLRSIGE